jgi:hypothetical protein
MKIKFVSQSHKKEKLSTARLLISEDFTKLLCRYLYFRKYFEYSTSLQQRTFEKHTVNFQMQA